MAAKTDIGCVRRSNQDTYYLPEGGHLPLAIVADGMGGANAGDTASRVAVDYTVRALEQADALLPAEQRIKKAMEWANACVFDMAQRDAELSGMGTTMTLLWTEGGMAYIGHIGDSRAYCLHKGACRQVTTDHTVVQAMVDQGLMTLEEARVHPQRNWLNRAMGVDSSVEVDVIEARLYPGDKWLLCSDGLTRHVSDAEIALVLGRPQAPEEICRQLVEMALERGGRDNITVLVAEEGIEP
nr:Stp1/IreP family PP2C-type Ser/Thr phosphatase [bacterium]